MRSLFSYIMLLSALTGLARAATPDLQMIVPQGVQRGAEADIELRGNRLADAREILFFSPGITVTSMKVVGPQQVTAHVKVDANAPIGENCVRLRANSGISEIRTIYVGPFPIVKSDQKINIDFEHAQAVPLNSSVWGIIQQEQSQFFSVEARKDQRLTIEVHGMRLGHMFDPYVAILDENKKELAASDDTALAMQDSIVSLLAPKDGKYTILLRDSAYGGGPQAQFLLHVGSFIRPTILYPLGGQAGTDVSVRFIGDLGGTFEQTLKPSLSTSPKPYTEVFIERDGLTTPSPNFFRVCEFPNVLEQEPNDDLAHATVAPMEVPLALNGIISKPAETDFFRFKAKKGQPLDVRVYARSLRSPLDSVIVLFNSQGRQIASNDDSGQPDSYIRFDPPADGEYSISITDQLHQGGPEFAYRIELTPTHPAIALSIPQYNIFSQERWTVPVPRGNRYATLMRVTRSEFGGEVSIAAPNLPDGIKMTAPDIANFTDVTPVLFEAADDAPIAGGLFPFDVRAVDPKQNVSGHYLQTIELVYGQNNSMLYKTAVDRLSVSATQEAPFKLHVEQPKAPMVQNGSLDLKVHIERQADFKGPVSLRFLFSPPGIGAVAGVDVPADKADAVYPLNTTGNAPLRKWKVCVVGSAEVNGPLWVSSELIDVEVAAPYIAGRIQLSAVEQGKPAQVLCKLEQRAPFEGKAKIELAGLPSGVTAQPVEITSADTQVIIPIALEPKSPVGNHNSLYCKVMVLKDGQEIIHNIARGGVLRIDPASKASPQVAQKKPADPSKPLSRLEKLRQDQGGQ
ncbi:MAG TPA: PPC domain-containing protein [Humisphaera sp.]|nr:PPC domain-containing protein [Humisphaera sp.]